MVKANIISGKTYLGIELGSTRIKACLVDDSFSPVASGSYEWENTFDGKYWTYSIDEFHTGVKECYKNLCDDVLQKYDVVLEQVGSIGISAMMHGYLAFDKDGRLLVPFRTWRNTTTKEAADVLSSEFSFNVPQRWSIAHLYQAILNNEPHINEIAHITTLSGYIHYLLTGKYEIGVGDASGMFPIDEGDYDEKMLDKFDAITNHLNLPWKIRDILPKVKSAGVCDSFLTKEGAEFLDCSGKLKSGICVCPPEGDAGTGMVATNAVSPKTGNVSAGTSIFAMVVLEKSLKNAYPQIDIVTTPHGAPVAMVHCNNCCNELDVWVNIFGEFCELMGNHTDKSTLYNSLYRAALAGDCNGIVAYNYLSGEHITNIKNGRPMYFRLTDSKMNLASFMKAQLYSAIATLTMGMDILFDKENVNIEKLSAHGGLFKVEGVAQQILANALNTSVSVTETAGEGGAWGMALLAAYAICNNGKTLPEWLDENVFSNMKSSTLYPDKTQTDEFNEFKRLYQSGLAAESNLELVH